MTAKSLLVRLGVAFLLAWSAPLLAAELDQTVLLVAKREFRHPLYGASVLIAKPVGERQHLGFIINRPTRLTLSRLFPDHAPSRKVEDPVYLGGPFYPRLIFALVQREDSPGQGSLQLMRDLFVAFEVDTVDRIIEHEAGRARFVAGLVAWRPGELRAEIERGLWHVLEPDAAFVLRDSAEGLWEELLLRSERRAKRVLARR